VSTNQLAAVLQSGPRESRQPGGTALIFWAEKLRIEVPDRSLAEGFTQRTLPGAYDTTLAHRLHQGSRSRTDEEVCAESNPQREIDQEF
jgi:hypothetical protein